MTLSRRESKERQKRINQGIARRAKDRQRETPKTPQMFLFNKVTLEARSRRLSVYREAPAPEPIEH